jgi:hypothetical protein
VKGEWTQKDTSTHQDHVIAHVLGATVLGYFLFDEALHLLLDMGFIWTIYLDGEMGLLSQGLLVEELDLDSEERQRVIADIDLFHKEGAAASGLLRMTPSPVTCLIKEVTFFAKEDRRRLVLRGEEASLAVECCITSAEILLYEF